MIEATRERERKLKEAKTEEERVQARTESSIFRISLIYSDSEADIVRGVVGEKRAVPLACGILLRRAKVQSSRIISASQFFSASSQRQIRTSSSGARDKVDKVAELIDHQIALYLKVVEYKRSIGTTQWTVMSIFLAASGGTLALSLNLQGKPGANAVRFLGFGIYMLGFLLYSRYRGLNRNIANYLVGLEQRIKSEMRIDFGFQQYLNQFDRQRLSTNAILKAGGVFYLAFVLYAFLRF